MVTLLDSLESIKRDKQGQIPWIVRLLENPQSPIALPGKIDLFNHDCLHILLEREFSLQDEAFIIGFWMGNDPKTKPNHVKIFKTVSSYLYPKKYRLKTDDFFDFDLGFNYGKTLSIQFNRLNFANYLAFDLQKLQRDLGIRWEDLKGIRQIKLDCHSTN